MKRFKQVGKRLAAALLVVGVAVPVLAFAANPNCDRSEHHRMGGNAYGAWGGGPGMMKKMVRELDLTEAQQAQLKAMKESHRSQADADRDAEHAQREAYHQLVKSGASEAELKAQADQIASKMSEHMVQMALFMQELRGVLTAQQLEKMDTLHADHMHKNGRCSGSKDAVDE